MSNNPAPAKKKETVIVVHGTFAAPKAQLTNWYQHPAPHDQETNFVTKLDAALKKRGSTARCWAHSRNGNDIYSWSGRNDWAERVSAAEELVALVDRLERVGWACHLVAHSHGGNILADALPHVQEVSGSLTTLGTPFVDAKTPVTNRLARSARFFYSFSLLVILAVYVALPLSAAIGVSGEYMNVVALAILAMFWLDVPWRLWQIIRKLFGRSGPIAKGRDVRMLCLNSTFDEAWQLLYHVRRADNPLHPKHSLIGHLFNRLSDVSSG